MSDEWLDVLDDENRVIGRELRSVIHQRGLRHRGADVFLFTRDGKLLVQTRTVTRAAFPGAFDCSAAEHVLAGEDFLQAALRGMREEIGVTGVELGPMLDFSNSNSPTDHETSRLFQGIVEPAQVHFDPVEVARIDYFTLPELEALMERGIKFSRWFEQTLRWRLGKPHTLKIFKVY